jgi:hypothetical protein
MPYEPALTIRSATHEDLPALDRLATLDSRCPLTGPILLAEADGVLVAARSASTGEAIADPFVPTLDVLALLALRTRRPAAPRVRRALGLPVPHLRRRPATA